MSALLDILRAQLQSTPAGMLGAYVVMLLALPLFAKLVHDPDASGWTVLIVLLGVALALGSGWAPFG